MNSIESSLIAEYGSISGVQFHYWKSFLKVQETTVVSAFRQILSLHSLPFLEIFPEIVNP